MSNKRKCVEREEKDLTRSENIVARVLQPNSVAWAHVNQSHDIMTTSRKFGILFFFYGFEIKNRAKKNTKKWISEWLRFFWESDTRTNVWFANRKGWRSKAVTSHQSKFQSIFCYFFMRSKSHSIFVLRCFKSFKAMPTVMIRNRRILKFYDDMKMYFY